MFHDPERFAVLRALRHALPVFQRELASLRRDDFLPWPEPRASVGEWLLFPLFAAAPPPGFAVDYAAHRRRCPRSVDVLRDHPAVFSAAFSWLDPGAHVLPHVDLPRPFNLRAHLGLRAAGSAPLRCGREVRPLGEGELLLVDTRLEHEAFNAGPVERVALVVDFEYARDEEAGLVADDGRARRSPGAGPASWRHAW